MRFTIGVVALLAAGCAYHSPTEPTAAASPTPSARLIVSGQSNAVLLLPAVQAIDPGADGYAMGSTPIAQWAPAGFAWQALVPTLHAPVTAFVWWQGESDPIDWQGVADNADGTAPTDPAAFARVSAAAYATYRAAFLDVVTRVRASVGNPNLRIEAVELGPYYRHAPINQALQDVLAQVGGRFIRTNDLAWDAGLGHLQPQTQYAIVAQRALDASR